MLEIALLHQIVIILLMENIWRCITNTHTHTHIYMYIYTCEISIHMKPNVTWDIPCISDSSLLFVVLSYFLHFLHRFTRENRTVWLTFTKLSFGSNNWQPQEI